MGRRASDDSEGKEASDSAEKYASDGSEGSEAYENTYQQHLIVDDKNPLKKGVVLKDRVNPKPYDYHSYHTPLNVFSF